MRPTRMPAALLSLLTILLFPVMGMAAVPITVEIDGQICTGCTGNDTVEIPDGTYGGVTISGLAAGTKAVVFAGNTPGNPDDGNIDFLTIRNAKIKGAQANTEYKIVFWGTYQAGPSGDFYYKITGQNNLFVNNSPNQPATGSWVQAKGFIEHAAGSGNWYQITSSQLVQTINSLNFKKVFLSPNTLSQGFNNVNNPRVLKGELKFKVANTIHELQLTDTNGIRILNSPNPGPGDQCENCEVCEPPPAPKLCKGWVCDWPPFSWFTEPLVKKVE